MLIVSALPSLMHVSKLGTSSLQSAIVGLSVSGAQWQGREEERFWGEVWKADFLIDCEWVVNRFPSGSMVEVIKQGHRHNVAYIWSAFYHALLCWRGCKVERLRNEADGMMHSDGS